MVSCRAIQSTAFVDVIGKKREKHIQKQFWNIFPKAFFKYDIEMAKFIQSLQHFAIPCQISFEDLDRTLSFLRRDLCVKSAGVFLSAHQADTKAFPASWNVQFLVKEGVNLRLSWHSNVCRRTQLSLIAHESGIKEGDGPVALLKERDTLSQSG